MKKISLISILLSISIVQMVAADYVTIEGIKYQLDGGGSGQIYKWGDIEHYASIQGYTEPEVSIPKSFVYNGIEYFVTCCTAGLGSSIVKKVEYQDDVTLISESGVPSSVETVIIGKNVRIIGISNYTMIGGESLKEVYCKDEIPMPLCTNFTSYQLDVEPAVLFFGSKSSFSDKQKITIYVPLGAEKAYRTAVGWSSYLNIIGSEECGYASNYGGGAIGAELINVQANYGDELVGIVNQETSVPIVVNSTSKIKSFTISVELPEKIVLTDELSNAIVPANETISIDANRNEDGIITINGIVNNEALEPGKNVLLNINVITAWQNTYTVKLSNISLTTPTGETKSIPDSETKLVMQGVRGDMNGDGRVDLSDALYIINLATGLAE